MYLWACKGGHTLTKTCLAHECVIKIQIQGSWLESCVHKFKSWFQGFSAFIAHLKFSSCARAAYNFKRTSLFHTMTAIAPKIVQGAAINHNIQVARLGTHVSLAILSLTPRRCCISFGMQHVQIIFIFLPLTMHWFLGAKHTSRFIYTYYVHWDA